MFIIGIIIFLLAFAALAWRNLEWALLALVFLLPTYLIRFNVGLPMTLLEGMILVIFVAWLWQSREWLLERIKNLKTGTSAINQYPFAWPLIVWLLVSLVAVAVSGFSWPALGIWRAYFFEPALLYIVVVNVCNSKEKILRLCAAFGLSVVVIAVFAVYQYLTGNLIPNPMWASAIGRRATSFFPYPNAVGLYVGPIALLALGAFAAVVARGKNLFHCRFVALFWLLVGLACIAAIVCARSEGAALGVFVAGIIFGLCVNKYLRLATIGLIVASGFVFAAVPSLRTRAADTLLLRTFSGQVRRAQWHETWQMLRDGKLLLGAGLNNYQAAVAPYHVDGIFVKDYHDPEFQRKVVFNEAFRAKVWQPLEIYMYPHNIMLNFWSELGILGVLAFLWIVILFFYYGVRSYHAAKRNNDPFAYVTLGLMSALAVWLIHGLVDVPYFKNDLAAMFWILMGAMSVIWIIYERNRD